MYLREQSAPSPGLGLSRTSLKDQGNADYGLLARSTSAKVRPAVGPVPRGPGPMSPEAELLREAPLPAEQRVTREGHRARLFASKAEMEKDA